MEGKTCLVTGASSGIGLETAVALARAGSDLSIVCRTAEKGARTAAVVAERSGRTPRVFAADLGSQKAIRALAAEVNAALPRLDVLVNNAGSILGQRSETVDGLETTFAVNHLGYFLLTSLLEPKLRASAPARVVSVASDAHRSATMDFDDLQGERSYSGWGAYCQSKLANVMFTYELARRLDGSGVTANTLHPGVVGTNFANAGPAIVRGLFRLARPFLASPAKGASTSIYLATSPEVEGVSGKYFVNRRDTPSSAASYDRAAQERLWAVSERLTAAGGERPSAHHA
jgi:retinol dehydrogenase-14